MSLNRLCYRAKPTALPIRPPQAHQCRSFKASSKQAAEKPSSNSFLASYQERVRQHEAAAQRYREGRALPTDPPASELPKMEQEPNDDVNRGSLAKGSIFDIPATENPSVQSKAMLYGNVIPDGRMWAIDPKPNTRRRWERRKVIQDVRRTGPLPRHIQLKRTERAMTLRSPLIRTSMKKLSPLANQIQGKTLEEAILQMQYSRKKPAVAIKEHLELARDHAIVQRGMGLGKINGNTGEATRIRLKDGTPHEIQDLTSLYVSRAWVGKGPYGKVPNKRARGRIDLLKLPQTSISVQIKEEATRVREHTERVAKEARKKPWIQMPNRPLVGQRQYYTW